MVCFRDYEITRGYKLWTAWGFRWLETPRAFITSPRTMCRLFQPSYQKDCLRDFRAKGFLHLWLEPNFWLVSPNSPMHHLNPNLHETPLVPWSFQANHASQFSLWLAGVQASASGIDQNSHLGPHHFHPNQNWYLSTRIPCPQNTAANLLRRLKHCNKLLQLVIWFGDLVPWQDPTIIAKVGSQDSESVVKKICQKKLGPTFLATSQGSAEAPKKNATDRQSKGTKQPGPTWNRDGLQIQICFTCFIVTLPGVGFSLNLHAPPQLFDSWNHLEERSRGPRHEFCATHFWT